MSCRAEGSGIGNVVIWDCEFSLWLLDVAFRTTLCSLHIINIILHPLSRCQNVVFNGECLRILLYFCQWHFPKVQEGCCSHEAVKCQSDDSMLSNSLRTVGDTSRKLMRNCFKSPSILEESFTCMGFSQRRYSENKKTRFTSTGYFAQTMHTACVGI